jgi:nitroreductase
LGTTWCSLLKASQRNKYVCDFYSLREKVIPIAIIALGYPAEKKDSPPRYDETKVHWETW